MLKEMNRNIKLFLLFVTLLPFFMVWLWLNQPMNSYFSYVYPINFLLLILLSVYIWHVFKSNQRMRVKVIWVLFLIVFNFILFPFYWYFYIWNSKKECQ